MSGSSIMIVPDWPAPETVRAFSTTREGGYSNGPYREFNLGDHVGDLPELVALNRARLQQWLGSELHFTWLQQVHGTQVVQLDGEPVVDPADAAVSQQSLQVCLVMTADCLPVLFCNRQGTVVAAAHAGWRGLLAGVLENTIAAMQCPAEDLLAWMGPAIGPSAFQVGEDVRQPFLQQDPAAADCFQVDPQEEGKWLADIYALARLRLANAGVQGIYGGEFCTYSESRHFFSYRRDGDCGRMATGIWLVPQSRAF